MLILIMIWNAQWISNARNWKLCPQEGQSKELVNFQMLWRKRFWNSTWRLIKNYRRNVNTGNNRFKTSWLSSCVRCFCWFFETGSCKYCHCSFKFQNTELHWKQDVSHPHQSGSRQYEELDPKMKEWAWVARWCPNTIFLPNITHISRRPNILQIYGKLKL